MGLKGYRLWVIGQLDSTCRAPPGVSGWLRGLSSTGCVFDAHTITRVCVESAPPLPAGAEADELRRRRGARAHRRAQAPALRRARRPRGRGRGTLLPTLFWVFPLLCSRGKREGQTGAIAPSLVDTSCTNRTAKENTS
jgi:hypothetical protein